MLFCLSLFSLKEPGIVEKSHELVCCLFVLWGAVVENELLPYIEIPMEHHPEEQSFSFRFPDGFPIGYVAWLSYRRYGVEHMTPALFSNYRETMN